MSELVVYLGDSRAGQLVCKDNGNLQFRYDAGYGGPPLSQSLPIQVEAHPHAVCRAVFGGLLPESEGRAALARSLGLSAGNDYSLLAEIGGDCAGAIVLLPAGEKPPREQLVRSVSNEELDEIVRELPRRPLAADPEAGIRLSLAGAQPKLPLILDSTGFSLPLNAATPTTHIVKPEPTAFPGLVDNEGFCMELARSVGLSAARTRKERTPSGVPYLLVERYDRDLSIEPIRRLHQEDFCQALGHPSDRKYQNEGGPSVRQSIALIRAASAVPAQDLPAFWRALVFNWLIGNCDAHAKNFSLLYDSGAPTLAPLYDLIGTTVFDGVTRRLAMSLDGAQQIGEVDGKTWQQLAAETGVRPDFAKVEAEALTERTVGEADLLRNATRHSNDTAHAVYEGILERASRL